MAAVVSFRTCVICVMCVTSEQGAIVSVHLFRSRKRQLCFGHVTLERPVDPQMDTALVEKAVEKLVRGPTCGHRVWGLLQGDINNRVLRFL